MKQYLMQFESKRQERNEKEKRAEMNKIYKQLKENK